MIAILIWSFILQQTFLFFFSDLGFMARQDYFTHFKPSQSLGGAKTGKPWEKPPDYAQAELGSSHVTRARLEPRAVRWRVIKSTKD